MPAFPNPSRLNEKRAAICRQLTARSDVSITVNNDMVWQYQGVVERWHRSMKNQVLPTNHHLPGDLKSRIAELIEYYNTQRDHESLNRLTPEDVYTDRGQTVLNRRTRIKQKSLADRRRLYD
ncbi:MAG: hypothetical protein ACI88G_001694 [Woeseiaceae bacterium]|jgi:hypothetical protein